MTEEGSELFFELAGPLLASGRAGRCFREWVAVRERDPRRWEDLLGEALDLVGGEPT